MHDTPSPPDPAEELLLRFQLEYETADDKPALVARYCAEHPAQAPRIRARINMMDAMSATRPDAEPEMPKELGEFRIVRRLANGGMGEIYLAEHARLRRRVAVKIIRRGRTSPISRARFEREQRVLAALHQTHIVPIHTAGEDDQLQYFVMPFIDGAALHHVVRTALQLETKNPASQTPPLQELASMIASNVGQVSNLSRPEAGGEPSPHSADCSTTSARSPTDAPSAPLSPPTPLTLSMPYFRSVAHAMADAAEALHHAHQAAVLHRDLKPSNLMVDTQGHCWNIDFGLARYLNDRADPDPNGKPAELTPELLTVSGIMGTPHYMAPEQWNGQAEVTADVWGLGATLYELLTLRRPFDGATDAAIRQAVQTKEPAPPRQLVRNVPSDLAAICLKSLHKEPGRRYQTGEELAEDLRRWLRFEPTLAWPTRVPRRAFLWARRNKGWAAALALAILGILGTAGAGIRLELLKTETANARAAEADAHERQQKRELLMLQAQGIRLGTHQAQSTGGWSDRAWDLTRQAAVIRGDGPLRDQAAALLIGIDARVRKSFDELEASSVAWDGEGKQLLIGGWDNVPAKLWNMEKDALTPSKQVGPGPVAFRDDGTPLQLVPGAKDPSSLLLWDVAKQQLVQEFKLPIKDKLQLQTLALSPNGSVVAAALALPGEKGQILVWDARTGKVLARIERRATALAVSPDGELLAAGNVEGHIRVWSLPAGKPLADLHAEDNRVLCLTFARDYLLRGRKETGPNLDRGWLLASGHAGGLIVIWDLDMGMPRNFCRGSSHDVYGLAFSPDSNTLASVGRGNTLWDVATGRPLLELVHGDWETGVAFSRDGQKLAKSCRSLKRVVVWDLEAGRGLRTFRGLAGPVARVGFSPDDRLVAALSDDWRLAIWEADTGLLRQVLGLPRGFLTDNACWAFGPDNQLAFSSGRNASLWDLATGKRLGSWDLPDGLVDRLAFHSSGKLLLFRVETADKAPLEAWTPPPRLQRVCRIRDLLGKEPLKPIKEIEDFNWHVYDAVPSRDGRFFAVAGLHGPQGQKQAFKVYDGLNGNRVWTSQDFSRSYYNPQLTLDPTGRILALTSDPDHSSTGTLIELPTGQLFGTWPLFPKAISPGARYGSSFGILSGSGCYLYRKDDKAPLVTLGIDAQPSVVDYGFNAAGTHLAWGNRDGSVIVCDINNVQRRLASIGLGW